MFIYHFGWLGKYLALVLCGVLSAYDVAFEASVFKNNDYCNDKACPQGNKHIMCRLYKPAFPLDILKNCTMLYDFMPLKPKWAKLIVETLNKKRGMIAQGLGRDYTNKTTFARAANYMKLHWDQKLATLSQLVAGYTCDPPDKYMNACCHTDSYPNPMMFHTTVYYTFPGWYLQHRDANFVYSAFSESKMEDTIKLIFDDFYLRKFGDSKTLPRYDGALYSYSVEAIGCGYSLKRYNSSMTSLTLVCYVYPYKLVNLEGANGSLLYKVFTPPKKPICVNTTVSCTDMSSFSCQCPADAYPDEQCLCTKFHRNPDLCDVDSCDPNPPMFPIFGQWDLTTALKTGITFEETAAERNKENVRKENLFSKQRKLRLHRISKVYINSEQKYATDIGKFIETLNMLEEKIKKIKLNDEKKKKISAKIRRIIEISDEKQIIKDIFKSEPAINEKVIDEKSYPTSTASPVKLYEKILEHRKKHKHHYDDLESYEDQNLLPKQETYVGLYDYYDETKLNGMETPLHLNTNFVDRYKEHHKTGILYSKETESFLKPDVVEHIEANDHFYSDYADNGDHDQLLTQVTNGRPHNNKHEMVAKLKNEFSVPNNLKHDPFNSKDKDEYVYDEYDDNPHSDYDYDENYSDYEYYDYVEDLVKERKFFYEKKLRALYKAKPLYTKRGAFPP